MSIIKGLFGKKSNADTAPRVRSISVAPGQSQEEQDANRTKMEAELAESRAAREARKADEAK